VERIASIDLLRIVAATGIVWFHTEGIPHRQIGYAGLPIFLLIFYSLITRHAPTRTMWDFVKIRADRLLKPWLFWSIVYGVCRLAEAVRTMDFSELSGTTIWGTFLCGTSIHLWYLPFAFLSGCVIYQAHRWVSKVSAETVVVFATAIGVLGLVACEITEIGNDSIVPLPQWRFALAAVPLGLAIGQCLTISRRQTQRLLLAVVGTAVVATCALLYSRGFTDLAVPYALAVVLVCLAHSWRIPSTALVAAVAPLTLGIYLLHPLVIYGLKLFVAPDRHWVAFVGLTVCLSGLTTWVLTLTPLRRFV